MTAKIQELDEKRRDDILNSALKEFASQGYDKASTNIIAKEAKMSKALMFHYVGSKKDLFLAVYDYFIIAKEIFSKDYDSLIFFKLKC